MGNDALGDFLNKLTSDTGLQRELEALGRGKPEVSPQEVVDFAAAKGYRFSVDDISGELSDESLEAVAGGMMKIYQYLAKK